MNSFFKFAVPCLLLAQTLGGAVLSELDATSLPAGEFSGQTGRWNTNVPARVETVGGKQAIVFDGTQVVISELLAAQKLTAFSVEAWVLNPDVTRQETIAALTGPKGGSGAECNFSSGASAGAFRSGFKAATPFASLPSAAAWHHVAWCFDGSVLRVFVDGEAELGLNSSNFADRLLSKHQVAVVPGIAFGNDATVRLSYATSLDVIKKGLDHFEEFCKTL
jgi:hypothetical protein